MSTARSPRSASRHSIDEAGTGLVSTAAGLLVFLVLLLLAVQVTYDLYATSAVTAAAYDAARIVAGADRVETTGATGDAEAGARRALGDYGSRAAFTWTVTADAVRLRVVARNPGFLPVSLRQPLGLDEVDRTVQVRVERLR
jgi:Flp pilus assembly protein TadG